MGIGPPLPAATVPVAEARRLEVDVLLGAAPDGPALVRADVANPGLLDEADFQRLRYLLGFARLTSFQPGAAERGGRTERPDVSVADEVEPLRDAGRRRAQRSAAARDATTASACAPRREALGECSAPLPSEPAGRWSTRHGGDFSAAELDAEAGRTTLVSVAGGGGGAGYVYIGAYRAAGGGGDRARLRGRRLDRAR